MAEPDSTSATIISFGPFVLDRGAASLSRGGEIVDLQPKVLDLLALLSSNPGRIFSKGELLSSLWPDTRVTEASLHQSLRKARRALGDDPDAPRYIEAVSRRGWRWIAPVELLSQGDRADDSVEGLFGRRSALEALVSRCSPGAILALHGPAGVGKTALARAALGRIETPSIEISLRSCLSSSDVARAIGAALRLPPDDLEARPQEALEASLAGRELLLLLDDASAAAPVLREALARWSGERTRLCWLVTSRVAPPGLPLLPVAALSRAAALAMLAARSGLPEGHLAPLLDRLDGLPLAIELAAARLRLLSPDQLLARLNHSNAVLSSGEGASLQAALLASLDLLEAPDRELLCAASAFDGVFRAEELEEIAGIGALDSLDRLLSASLVERRGEGLALGNVVRAFAAERASAGCGADLLARLVERTAERARLLLAPAVRLDTDALLALQASRSRWAGALQRASDPSDREALACALALAVRYSGPWKEACEALESLPSFGPRAALLRGEYAARLGRIEEASALLSGVGGEGDEQAAACMLLARLRAARGETEIAQREAERALTLACALRSDAVAGLALDVLGTIARVRGDLDGVRRCYRSAAARLQRQSCRIARAVVAQNQAANESALGLHEEGISGLASALDAIEELPLDHIAAIIRANLAQALLTAGRAREAEPLLQRALTEAERTGDRVNASKGALDLAMTSLILGDGARSEALLRRPVEEADALSRPLSRSLACTAWAALCRGEDALAVARFEASLAACGQAEQISGWQGELWALGLALARLCGDETLSRRLSDHPPPSLPGATLLSWVSSGMPRPAPADVASGRLPVDCWALWACGQRRMRV